MFKHMFKQFWATLTELFKHGFKHIRDVCHAGNCFNMGLDTVRHVQHSQNCLNMCLNMGLNTFGMCVMQGTVSTWV